MARRPYHVNNSTTDFNIGGAERTSQFAISMSESQTSVAFRDGRQMSIADMQYDQERLRTANSKALRVLITPDLPCTPENANRRISTAVPVVQPSTSRRLPKIEAHRRSFANHASDSRTNSETTLVASTTKSRDYNCKRVVLHLTIGFCLGVFATLLIIGCVVVLINPFATPANCSLPTVISATPNSTTRAALS